MFNVTSLHVYYGESHVVHDASFSVRPGEAVALMGRNGMGKTTLLKALVGMIPSRSGRIELEGRNLESRPSHERVRAGLAFVPQGRMVFPLLTVEENVLSGLPLAKPQVVPDYVWRFFPVLREMRARRAGNLSGGQQQMLAIARALVTEPRVLVLDEPTEGIQPSIIKELAQTLVRLRAERGFAIVVSEQVLSFALEVADRFLVLDRGRIVHEESRASVDVGKLRSYLTV